MAKPVTASCGPIKVSGKNATEAKQRAFDAAGRVLSKLDGYMPNMLVYAGYVCMVYPVAMPDEDGMDYSVAFMYTNPRTLDELGNGPDRLLKVGSAGYYPSATDAASAATVHIMTCFLPAIPDETPVWVTPADADRCENLRGRAAYV